MGSFTFRHWLAVCQVFGLDHGRVLTLEAVVAHHLVPGEARGEARRLIKQTRASYVPDPAGSDHLVAAVIGLKPAAIVQYQHHPDNPAAAVVHADLTKSHSSAGAIQAELLRHGIKVRRDFHIKYVRLPGYSQTQLIVGGREEVEELAQLLKLQYYLDIASSEGHPPTAEVLARATRLLGGDGPACEMGNGGMECRPIHRRIGQLLGYTPQQIEKYISDMSKTLNPYDHLPDIPYPMSLPPSVASLPRRKPGATARSAAEGGR